MIICKRPDPLNDNNNSNNNNGVRGVTRGDGTEGGGEGKGEGGEENLAGGQGAGGQSKGSTRGPRGPKKECYSKALPDTPIFFPNDLDHSHGAACCKQDVTMVQYVK